MRGLTEMIATEGTFFWCAVTPRSARKHYEKGLCTVSELPMNRGKNLKSPGKLNLVNLRDWKPLKWLFY